MGQLYFQNCTKHTNTENRKRRFKAMSFSYESSRPQIIMEKKAHVGKYYQKHSLNVMT